MALIKAIDVNRYSDLDLAFMVLLGYFGTGSTRKKKLGSRYKDVQALVNQISGGVIPDGSGNTEKIRKALEEAMPSQAEMKEFIDEIMKGA